MARSTRKPSTPRAPSGGGKPAVERTMHLMAKARVLSGSDVEESAAIDTIVALNASYTSAGAVTPRYDPESLHRYAEITPHLRPSIDALCQNIDGFGFRSQLAQPWMIDLESEEATEAIRQALVIERWVDEQETALERDQEKARRRGELLDELDRATSKGDAGAKVHKALDDLEQPSGEQQPEGRGEAVTDDEVKAAREMLRDEVRREGFLFDAWFRNCCSDRSFVELRRNVRADVKTHGWGGIEFLRDGFGRLKRLSYVPGYTIRPMSDRGDLVDVTEDDSVTPLSEGREVIVKRRFRVYVQIVGGQKVYFKSPGDPRVVSRTTGVVYRDERTMRRPRDAEPPGEGPEAVPANELLYIAEHDPTSPCSPPVWIGNLVSVLGGREADETNYYYLADKAIPAGVVFVSGGRLARGTKERLESRIKNELAGAQGSGKLLVVEALSSANRNPNERTVLPTITFQSLREAQNSDALFINYDVRTSDRIGASFRLAPLLRGYTPDNLNRATAQAALYFAEQQVFQPERDEFDWLVNKYVLPQLGIRFLRFQSLSPPTKSVEEFARLVQATAPHGAWTPNELRNQCADLLNLPMAKFEEEWANVPMALTLAGGPAHSHEGEPGEDGEGAADVAKRLRAIEARVAAFVTEELRSVGYDMEVRAGFVDPDALDGDGS